MFVHVLVQASSIPQVRTGALSGTSWVGRKASWLKFTLHEQDAGKRKRTPLYAQTSRYGYGWIDAPEPSLAPMVAAGHGAESAGRPFAGGSTGLRGTGSLQSHGNFHSVPSWIRLNSASGFCDNLREAWGRQRERRAQRGWVWAQTGKGCERGATKVHQE